MSFPLKSTYQPLTSNSALALVRRLQLFEESAALTCCEIGNANLNHVFQIIDTKSQEGVIIKQAIPYSTAFGKNWSLTLKRSTIESHSLLINATNVHQLVPKVFYSDETLAVTVMEDLSRLQILRTGLIEGKSFPLLSEHIGMYLARTLFYTSDFALEPKRKKELVQKFTNPELCKITEDLVFTDPFFDSATNEYEEGLQKDVELIWGNQSLKLEVAKLKYKYLTQAEALLHGDLHTGNIFASATETKVISPEFAFFGPIGFDIGQFIGNLLLNAISLEESKQEQLFDYIDQTWEVFSSTFTELWETDRIEFHSRIDCCLENLLEQTFEDMIGFAGCELIRRTIGLAHVLDLDGISSKYKRLQAKRHALALGTQLINNRTIIKDTQQLRNYFTNTLSYSCEHHA
ncbi:S-methyl-5-thioribose kinase [Litchfieldia salsa]|uniref:5'-methylthioribose kinase n=1 Tax=Litchfieldia salsa TaxID=930152 RepID=A0A1H0RZJ3_9BACI|nr:S-methyl-5-thioribose kinase [Litchfieldia salsa]SDP34795.1 5'-methylthioribose kinase [Litchfieldia salsa]